MKINVLTLFCNMFNAVLGESIIKRAISSGKVRIDLHNIRDYSTDKHRKLDARPFGGGPGMVLECQPVLDTLSAVKKKNKSATVILTSARGERLTQAMAHSLSIKKGLIIICGHYEGVDERIRSKVDREISIGDYVLTGGELAAMVIIDAVVRLLPGVVGKAESLAEESFQQGLLEYPQYTRPADYKGIKVPEVLLSGNHSNIKKWRKKEAVLNTIRLRPDLIKNIEQLEI